MFSALPPIGDIRRVGWHHHLTTSINAVGWKTDLAMPRPTVVIVAWVAPLNRGALMAPTSMALTCRMEEPSTASKAEAPPRLHELARELKAAGQTCFSASSGARAFYPRAAGMVIGSVLESRSAIIRSDDADSLPPCSSIIILQIASPNPVPFAAVGRTYQKCLSLVSGGVGRLRPCLRANKCP